MVNLGKMKGINWERYQRVSGVLVFFLDLGDGHMGSLYENPFTPLGKYIRFMFFSE